MRCIILGAGSVGLQIARSLSEENVQITLVEKNTDIIKNISSKLDCMVVEGKVPTPELLRSCGAEQANFFIACTDSDEVNFLSCGIVASLFPNVKRIARIRNQEYISDENKVHELLHIDHVVVPEIEACDLIMRSISYGALSEVYEFLEMDIQIRDFFVSNDSFACNKHIRDIALSGEEEFLIAIVQRGNQVYIPKGDYLVEQGDILYVAAHSRDFDALMKRFGQERKQIQKVAIIGGGKIGQQIARRLFTMEGSNSSFLNLRKSSASVCILDKDIDRCKELAGMFPRATVLNADISEEDVFLDEGLEDSDLLLSVTDNQETNIVVSQYAKTLGIPHVMALVIRNNYAHIANRLGIDVTINRKTAVVNSILRHIRGSEQKSFQMIFDGKIAIWEVNIQEDTRVVGKRIRDIDTWKTGGLILALRRSSQKDIILPRGDEIVFANDTLAIVAEKDVIKDISKLFGNGKS